MLESLNSELVTNVILFVVAFNVFLSGVSVALGMIKDKTKWEGDNKIHAALQKMLDVLKKVIDFVGYNPKH